MSSLSPREAAERDQVGRAIGIGLLISIALFHLLDGVSQFHKHPFVFALYVALMAGTLAVALLLLRTDSRLAWGLVALMAGLTFTAFTLSRTTGLPNFHDDVGNWTDPLGLSSLFVEGLATLLGLYKVATTPRIRHGTRGLVAAATGAAAGAKEEIA
jgi:hypothetical protein